MQYAQRMSDASTRQATDQQAVDQQAVAQPLAAVDRPASRPPTARSLPRFAVIGVLSFVVDAGTLFVAHGLLGIWLPLATAIAYGIAFSVNFGLNRRWSFASTGAVGGQVSRYFVLIGVNYVITVALVTGIAAAGLNYLVAKAIVAAVAAVVNYFACRYWVFR
jgi:putative flippase GtrA